MFVHHLAIVEYWSAHCDKSLNPSFFRLEGKHGEELESFSWLYWRSWQGSLGEWDLLFPLLQSARLTCPAGGGLFCYIAFSPGDWMLKDWQHNDAVFTDAWILQLCPHGTLCFPEQKPSFGVCKCMRVYNIQQKGRRVWISILKFDSSNISMLCLRAYGPNMYALNNLYATI